MRAAWSWLLRLEALLAATFLLLMVALVFAGGAARMLGHPLNWTIDLATCFFAWACFLCADIAWRNDGLMSIGLLTERLSPRARRLCAWCNYAIIAAFLVYVIAAGLWLAWVSRARAFQGIPEVSYSWVTMSMPVGAILLLVTTILKARAEFFSPGAPPAAAP